MSEDSADHHQDGALNYAKHDEEPPAPEIQRSKFYNCALALTVAMGGFHLGYFISIFNPFSDQFLEQSYNVTSQNDRDSQIGTINLCFTLGCMVGAMAGAYLLRWFGRIRSIIILESISILVMVAYYFSPENYLLLLVTRVLSGILVGMFNTVCP
jgi:SP family sugar:H+ symporter-like MFS transporter